MADLILLIVAATAMVSLLVGALASMDSLQDWTGRYSERR